MDRNAQEAGHLGIQHASEIDVAQTACQPSDVEAGREQASRAYETSLPSDFRLRHGQYYTPQGVCDLMLALANQFQNYKRVLEPACGSGAFLRRAVAQAREHGNQTLKLVGVEQNREALRLAQSALIPSDTPIELLADNFLTIQPESLGLFDLIIGNPPYVRQELLGQSPPQDKLNLTTHYAQFFAEYLNNYPEQKGLFSQKADLYQWFFLQAYCLLEPGGVLAFVVSNSWLDSVFGNYLRHFLSCHFHWLCLVESACERWFEDAAINPVIVILQKKKMPDELALSPCSVIRFHQPLSSWLPDSSHTAYWRQLSDKLRNLDQEPDVSMRTLTGIQLAKLTDDNGWNLAFRGPKILLHLLRQPDVWQPLSKLGNVRYPLKTGINAFFYLSREKAETWAIEPEFLVPVIRSAKKLKKMNITVDEVSEFLFHCPFSKAELSAAGKTGALEYIEWGEQQTSPPRQKRSQATPWPEIPSVRNNRPWHFTKALQAPHLLCNRFVDQRFFFALCDGDFMEDQTFYGLTLYDTRKHPPDLIAALLNSTLSCALLAFKGRASLGEGVLQFARCDMADFPVLNPDLYSEAERKTIRDAYAVLAESAVLAWSKVWDHPARIALDEAVLAPLVKRLQFSQDAFTLRTELAEAILKRGQERKAMAQSVRKPSTAKFIEST